MRGRIAYWLIGCLFVPLVLTGTWMQVRLRISRHHAKSEIKAGLSEDEKVRLTFSLDEIYTVLNWEHSREFEYKGEMYDILEQDTLGDSILYVCFHDVDETFSKKMIKWMAEKQRKGDNPNALPDFKWNSFFANLIYESDRSSDAELLYARSTKVNANYQRNILEYSITPPSPPPRFQFS